MSRRLALTLFFVALAGFAATFELVRLVESAGAPRAELRHGASSAAEKLATLLEARDERLRIEAYVTPAAEAPSHMRHLATDVTERLARLERAAPGRIEARSLEPAAQPEAASWLRSAGIAPWRARRVERDGYVEQPLWSSLRIALGERPPVVLNGLGPEHAAALEELCLRHAQELAAPRRPVVLFDAPPGFTELQKRLAANAYVIDVDLAVNTSLPPAHLLVWIEPRAAHAEVLELVDAFRARGGALLVAGAELNAVEQGAGATSAARIEAASGAYGEVLAHLGLALEGGLVLDPTSDARTLDTGETLLGAHRVRCIAPNQDFRLLVGQPNGSLLFAAPGAFRPDSARLADLGSRATVLATTSELALRTEAPRATLSWRELGDLEGEPVGELGLVAFVEPAEPWSGPALVLAAATPFEDDALLDRRYAHGALLDIALRSLAGQTARVRCDVARSLPPPLGGLSATERMAWRVFVVGGPPLGLLLVLLLRGRGAARMTRTKPWVRGVTARLAAGVVVLALAAFAAARVGADVDVTRSGANRPTAAEQALFAEWIEHVRAQDASAELVLETIFAPPDRLPPELRPHARAAEQLCAELARSVPGLEYRRVRATESVAERLAEEGVEPVLVASRLDERLTLRRVYAALRVIGPDAETVLQFPAPSSFEHLRLRVAQAVRRVATGEVPRIAIAAAVPRLSPAEAALEYQQLGLFPPRERDAWGPAARLLAAHGFEVRTIDPSRPAPLEPNELLLVLQPRRDAVPIVETLATHLARGGAAFVVAQHFEIVARQLAEDDLELRFWPRPLFADLERHYLPELGVELVRDVLFDRHMGALDVRTRVDVADGPPQFVTQASSSPFLVVASAARRTPLGQRVFAGAGDALLAGPSRISLDATRLARHGLVATPLWTTSEHAWSFAWEGGDLPPGVLAGDMGTSGLTPFNEPAPLAVLLEGPFPAAQVSGVGAGAALQVAAEREPAPSGRLLLIGASQPFQGDQLHLQGYDHAQVLLAAVSHLTLPGELAQLVAHRPANVGLDYVPPDERQRWRLFVIGVGPLALLLVAVLRRRLA